jgi:hypothetical protein
VNNLLEVGALWDVGRIQESIRTEFLRSLCNLRGNPAVIAAV